VQGQTNTATPEVLQAPAGTAAPLGLAETTLVPGATVSDEWELDVYSR
jgi:hypothetical protein